ncbi:MAG: isoprenylcysteine carboxylmethyltransferase family protein [Ignavibacteriales bacterium]|nr:isoprenylcysteine carboxylmethyltransferase family protein [Ignavibacteriales bacterium]
MGNFSAKVFNYRSYSPVPFLIVMFIFQKTTILSLVIGFGIVFIGEFIRLWGVSYAGSETRTTGDVGGTNLVISGPFAYVRNPLYVGNIFIYIGVGVMSMALFPYLQIGAFIFFYIQYRIIVNDEEKYLVNRFGSDYEAYRKNVLRFIPKLWPYKNKNLKQPNFSFKDGLKSESRTLQAITIVTIILVVLHIISLD